MIGPQSSAFCKAALGLVREMEPEKASLEGLRSHHSLLSMLWIPSRETTATGIVECWGIPGLTRGIDSCPGLRLWEPWMGVEAHVLPLGRKRGVAALG